MPNEARNIIAYTVCARNARTLPYQTRWRLHIYVIANFGLLRLFPVIKLWNLSRQFAVQTRGRGYGGAQSTTSLAK